MTDETRQDRIELPGPTSAAPAVIVGRHTIEALLRDETVTTEVVTFVPASDIFGQRLTLTPSRQAQDGTDAVTILARALVGHLTPGAPLAEAVSALQAARLPTTPSSGLPEDVTRLVDDFDHAAQTWGWEADQGTGATPAEAEKVYKTTRRQLLDHIAGLTESATRAEGERDGWKRAARLAGVCMSCALQAPEPFGCTDCLNTGWEGGSPTGFVPEAALTAMEVRADKLAEALKRIAQMDAFNPPRPDEWMLIVNEARGGEDASPHQESATLTVDLDGFTGTQVGSYVTREGKRGVVLQQVGTRVVHVYGEARVRPADVLTATETSR